MQELPGEKNLKEINKSSVMGMIIATIVRIFLFLAVLGVVVKGVTLDAANPAADAFKQGAGEIGYRFAGLVLLCAATHHYSVRLYFSFLPEDFQQVYRGK